MTSTKAKPKAAPRAASLIEYMESHYIHDGVVQHAATDTRIAAKLIVVVSGAFDIKREAEREGTDFAHKVDRKVWNMSRCAVDIWRELIVAKYLLAQRHELDKKGAMKKLANDKDGKQAAKRQIKQHWLNWKSGLKTFAGGAHFDRQMVEFYPCITATKTVERNRMKWEAEMRAELMAAAPKELS